MRSVYKTKDNDIILTDYEEKKETRIPYLRTNEVIIKNDDSLFLKKNKLKKWLNESEEPIVLFNLDEIYESFNKFLGEDYIFDTNFYDLEVVAFDNGLETSNLEDFTKLKSDVNLKIRKKDESKAHEYLIAFYTKLEKSEDIEIKKYFNLGRIKDKEIKVGKNISLEDIKFGSEFVKNSRTPLTEAQYSYLTHHLEYLNLKTPPLRNVAKNSAKKAIEVIKGTKKDKIKEHIYYPKIAKIHGDINLVGDKDILIKYLTNELKNPENSYTTDDIKQSIIDLGSGKLETVYNPYLETKDAKFILEDELGFYYTRSLKTYQNQIKKDVNKKIKAIKEELYSLNNFDDLEVER